MERSAIECRQISLAFVEALAAMPAPAATESLARHAVFSLAPDVRSSAIDATETIARCTSTCRCF